MQTPRATINPGTLRSRQEKLDYCKQGKAYKEQVKARMAMRTPEQVKRDYESLVDIFEG
ncbi:MAG: hypothetical protein M1343_08130 [Chloroflexi bacterium]|nr:hypothetical protein [Chloroflexota bacterium]